MTFPEKINAYMTAAYALLAVATPEEERLEEELVRALPDRKFFVWDSQNGISNVKLSTEKNIRWESIDDDRNDLEDCLEWVTEYCKKVDDASSERTLIILKDALLQFERPLKKIGYIRTVKNLCLLLRNKKVTLLFCGVNAEFPAELKKLVQTVDFSLPDNDSIMLVINKTLLPNIQNKGWETPSDEQLLAVCEAAKGLTLLEIEDAIALAVTQNTAVDSEFIRTVFREKVQHIKNTGLIEYIETNINFDSVGGLDALKEWVRNRMVAFTPEAKNYGLRYPKGALLCGIAGCGKTLIAKAIANEFDLPLFKLDIASLFNKFVGGTETNFIEMTKIVDSIGACVLLVDEFEKSLSSAATSGAGDSGTGSRSFGTFLNWLNDRDTPCFIIGTSNNHIVLPPALKRPGRFDQLWWVDLPDAEERANIFAVHIKRIGRNPSDFDLEKLANATVDFSGAEIELSVDEGLVLAFKETGGKSEPTTQHILTAVEKISPQAKTEEKEIAALREDAKKIMRQAKHDAQPEQKIQKLRKL